MEIEVAALGLVEPAIMFFGLMCLTCLGIGNTSTEGPSTILTVECVDF